MALVTDNERAIVQQVITWTEELKHACESMLELLLQVKVHIAAENDAPGAGNEAVWDGTGGIVDWYDDKYVEARAVINAAHTQLPVITAT